MSFLRYTVNTSKHVHYIFIYLFRNRLYLFESEFYILSFFFSTLFIWIYNVVKLSNKKCAALIRTRSVYLFGLSQI